jgi:hypothetical protein
VQLKYEITQQEFLEMAWSRYRASARWKFALSLSALLLAAGVLLCFYADHTLGFTLVCLSLLFLLLIVGVTSLSFRRAYRRNSRMFGLRTITISDTGFISDNPLGRTETTWNMYEKFRETKTLFLLYQSVDLIGILPKRAFATAAELEHFRALLTSKVRSS